MEVISPHDTHLLWTSFSGRTGSSIILKKADLTGVKDVHGRRTTYPKSACCPFVSYTIKKSYQEFILRNFNYIRRGQKKGLHCPVIYKIGGKRFMNASKQIKKGKVFNVAYI